MRILLDECVNAGVRKAFAGHAVRTVSESGWRSTKDAALLLLAENGFDVFVTIDRNLARQNNLKTLRLGFIVALVPNNKITSYQPIFAELKASAEAVRMGEVIHVISPELK